MAKIAPLLALLLCSVAAPCAAAATDAPNPASASATRSTALRSDNGASAIATVSARILHAAAVGEGRAAPGLLMVARRTTVSAAYGRAVPALVYDFE